MSPDGMLLAYALGCTCFFLKFLIIIIVDDWAKGIWGLN